MGFKTRFYNRWTCDLPDLVVGCERVDDDGDGEGEDEDARDGGEAADELAEVRSGVEVVADGSDGHQAPPERLHERPREVGVTTVLLVLQIWSSSAR